MKKTTKSKKTGTKNYDNENSQSKQDSSGYEAELESLQGSTREEKSSIQNEFDSPNVRKSKNKRVSIEEDREKVENNRFSNPIYYSTDETSTEELKSNDLEGSSGYRSFLKNLKGSVTTSTLIEANDSYEKLRYSMPKRMERWKNRSDSSGIFGIDTKGIEPGRRRRRDMETRNSDDIISAGEFGEKKFKGNSRSRSKSNPMTSYSDLASGNLTDVSSRTNNRVLICRDGESQTKNSHISETDCRAHCCDEETSCDELRGVDLDKKDPLDLEPLNSEPKGNDKSKNNERLRQRQEREKILQKNRLAQQENLKNRAKRNLSAQRVSKADENSQHDENGHHFVSPVQKSTGHNLETEHILTSREHKKNDRSNDDALCGDWSSKSANHKPENIRCANCCGRPQHFPVEDRTRCSFPLENYGKPPGISTGREANRCELELINAALRTSGTSLIRAMEIGDSRLKGGCSAVEEKEIRIYDESSTANEGGSVVCPYDENESTERLRGGCGGCGGGRSCGSCPCGGCGGPACGSNTPGCSIRPAGCCGGNQPRGLPCSCRCRSCSDPCPPCGTCGGRNCGRWNSCAGSGGGKCCFPRNTRRRNGPDCCGGGGGGCGGCC